MNTEKNTIELNDVKLQVSDILFDFAIHQKASSNVDYFGTDYVNERMFIQFKGGTGAYIYNGVNMDLLDASIAAESIGKFVLTNIVKKFITTKFEQRLVVPVLEVAIDKPEDTEPSF